MTLTIPETAQDVSSAVTIVLLLDQARSVVVLRGDVDLYSVPTLTEAMSRIIASRRGGVVVDLAVFGLSDLIDSTRQGRR